MATGEGERIMLSIGVLGAITLVPLLIKFVRDRLRGQNVGGDPVVHQAKEHQAKEHQAKRPVLTDESNLPESEL
jgi:hypothetical protein